LPLALAAGGGRVPEPARDRASRPAQSLVSSGGSEVNWDDAVKTHTAWKMKLLTYIRDPGKKIDAAAVGVDNRCSLGVWLHGEGKQKLAALPEFETLIAEHARFHQAVGSVVEQVNAGKTVPDQSVLGWESDFAASSRSVVTTITALKRKVPNL
jgi:hypothetical protein